MNQLCTECSNKSVQREEHTSEEHAGNTTWWFQWEYIVNPTRYKATDKVRKQGSVQQLFEAFMSSLQAHCSHTYKLRNQFLAILHLREHLQEHEVIIHIDFAENYSCKWAKEIQSAHFGASHLQATLHIGVLQVGNNRQGFCTISGSTRHDAAAIWAYLQPVFKWIKSTQPDITRIHILSDGPSTQYKNKTNFFIFFCQPLDLRACGIFMKLAMEKAHKMVLVLPSNDQQIQHAYMVLISPVLSVFSNGLKLTLKFQCFFVDEGKIPAYDNLILKSIKVLPGTTQIHQMKASEPGTIEFRCLSCYCTDSNADCTCHGGWKTHQTSCSGKERLPKIASDNDQGACNTNASRISTDLSSPEKNSTATYEKTPDISVNFKVNDYVSAVYFEDRKWYISRIIEINPGAEAALISFMHPTVPSSSVTWPGHEDKCLVPFKIYSVQHLLHVQALQADLHCGQN